MEDIRVVILWENSPNQFISFLQFETSRKSCQSIVKGTIDTDMMVHRKRLSLVVFIVSLILPYYFFPLIPVLIAHCWSSEITVGHYRGT